MSSKTIVLTPSSWLYNAGVIGLLKVLERCDKKVGGFLKDDGRVEIVLDSSINSDIIFQEWDELTKQKLKISYKGKSGGTKTYYYANQTEESIKEYIENFLNNTRRKSRKGKIFTCSFCFDQEKTSSSKASFLSQTFSNILLSSERTFSNSYWNNSSSNFVCSRCEFILMNHHISFARLSDDSEVFVSVPSFRVMWYLNNYIQTLSEGMKERDKKRILGLSIFEMSRKIYVQLGRWEKMNIEVVIKYKEEKQKIKGGRRTTEKEEKIDFFSLPSDIVDILSDKDIAATLNQIREFKVMELILDGKFRELINFGERILRFGIKQFGEKRDFEDDKSPIRNILTSEENRKDPIGLAQKIFKLYALIESKIRREVNI